MTQVMHSNLKPLSWIYLCFSIWQYLAFEIWTMSLLLLSGVSEKLSVLPSGGKMITGKVLYCKPPSEHNIHFTVWIWNLCFYNWQWTSESSRSNCLEPEFSWSLNIRCIFTVNPNDCLLAKEEGLQFGMKPTWFSALSKDPNNPLASGTMRL